MSCKPIIGLNMDYRPATDSAPAISYLPARYIDCVSAAEGVPVVVPQFEDEDELHAMLDRLDGFVMIGGADLDPRRDGYLMHPAVRPMNPRREAFDRMLIDCLAERRIPVLAIGVGMQLLNVSQGGNLFYHLPEDMPEALPHRDSQDRNHRHGLDVVPGTLMERVYGDGEVRVNSSHHMAIDELAPGFRVTARCPDGVVEAIESEMHDWFAVGTQFHPEAESASALDIGIFEEFVKGVRQAVSAGAKQPSAARAGVKARA